MTQLCAHWHLNHGHCQVTPGAQLFITRVLKIFNRTPGLRLTLASSPQGYLSSSITVNTIHRDISTGYILRLLKMETVPGLVALAAGEAPSSSFAYPAMFKEVLKVLDKRHQNRSGEDEKLWEEMQEAKDAMEELLKNEMSSVSSCAAFLAADVDYARPTDLLWEDGKKSWDEPSVSCSTIDFVQLLSPLQGTAQFMSNAVIVSIGGDVSSFKLPQSPADDIESFFHVAIWAIFHNYYIEEDKLSHREKQIKSLILSNKTRALGHIGYLYAKPHDLSSQLAIEAQPVMEVWHDNMSKFVKGMRNRANIDVVLDKDAVDALWRRSVGWILCALSGVKKIVTIINSHLEELKTYADVNKANPQ